MSAGLWMIAFAATCGADPCPCQNGAGAGVAYGAPYGATGAYGVTGGYVGGATGYVSGQPSNAAVSVPGGVGGDQLFPYDAPAPWQHGYIQEIPAYGGYVGFRPYNYKHVLSQSQVAGGWGLQPTAPYSQQFWHRYHARATMHAQTARPATFPANGASLDPAVLNAAVEAELRARATRYAAPYEAANGATIPAGGAAPQGAPVLLGPVLPLGTP